MATSDAHWTSLRKTTAKSVEEDILATIKPVYKAGATNQLDQVLTAIEQIKESYDSLINPLVPGGHCGDLLTKGTNLSKCKTTKVFDPEEYVKALEKTLKDNTAIGKTPPAASRTEAQRNLQDDRANHQVILGYKQAGVAILRKIFGEDVVNDIVLDSSKKAKKLDEFDLADIIKHVKDSASHPTDRSRRRAKAEILVGHKFNFGLVMSQNISNLDKEGTALTERGIEVTLHDKVLIIRDQVEWAAKQKWAPHSLAALPNALKKLVDYDAIIKTDAVYKEICDKCIEADKGRDYSEAPAPPAPELAQLASGLTVDELEDLCYVDAYSVESESTASSKSRHRARKARKKASKYESESEDDSDDESTASRRRARKKKLAASPCPHCKRFGQLKKHPSGVTVDTCTFNPVNHIGARRWAAPIIKRVLKQEKKAKAKKAAAALLAAESDSSDSNSE